MKILIDDANIEVIKKLYPARIHSELGANTYTKIPVNVAGLEAIQRLRKAQPDAHITATDIYMPMQAFLAAKAGADYTAPYINRIDNLGADGIATAKVIQDMFTKNGLPCQILAASFKNSQQVQALYRTPGHKCIFVLRGR